MHTYLSQKSIKTGAFHFHGLVKGITDFYANSNGYYSHQLFDTIGFNSFSAIRDYNKCCNYITKYISKDCIKNEKGTVYISSRGLKKADKYEVQPFEPIKGWQFSNNYCDICDFYTQEMTIDEKLQFTIVSEIH